MFVRRNIVILTLAFLVALGNPSFVDASSDPPAAGATPAHPAAEVTGAHPAAVQLQALVDQLRDGLAIEEPVRVSVITSNARAMSVRAPREAAQPFDLSVEGAFLENLSEDELVAALAHELGHVWVFTHHPYLQTERLANEIAMRVVTRESLERVYQKVWARDDAKGDLVRFLGP